VERPQPAHLGQLGGAQRRVEAAGQVGVGELGPAGQVPDRADGRADPGVVDRVQAGGRADAVDRVVPGRLGRPGGQRRGAVGAPPVPEHLALRVGHGVGGVLDERGDPCGCGPGPDVVAHVALAARGLPLDLGAQLAQVGLDAAGAQQLAAGEGRLLEGGQQALGLGRGLGERGRGDGHGRAVEAGDRGPGHHRDELHPVVQPRPGGHHPVRRRPGQLGRVDQGAAHDRAGLLAQPQVEPGDHGELAVPAAPGRPQEVGIGALVAVQPLARGGDHVHRVDGEAGRAVVPGVPAVAAAEQEAGQAHVRAVADREEQAAGADLVVELHADDPGLHRRGPGGRVHGDLAQPGQVQQQAAVAQVDAVPAVPARAHRHGQPAGAGVVHRGHHVVLVGGRDDHGRVAGRLAGVPHRVGPGLLVPLVAAVPDPARDGVQAGAHVVSPAVVSPAVVSPAVVSPAVVSPAAACISSIRLPSGSVT
jgi:hypothetical protein